MVAKAGAVSEEVEAGLSRGDILPIYRVLQLTRQVEQVLVHLYRQNRVIGGLYRSLGQEATAVGSAWALRRRSDGTGDILSPAIRNLGALLAMGVQPVDVMRQYMAKADSPTRGREQNVHFTDYRHGWIGLISHLGIMMEVMAGVALSFRMRGEERVALCYVGDGAASTGAFHEGFNFAAVRHAPLVAIIENNAYAYSTPVSRQTAAGSFVVRADAYGVYGDACDGNDLFAVYAMTKRAVDHARSGAGAALLEVHTYRRKGHAEHDDQHYVPAGEIESWERRDPLDRFERRVLDAGWASADELEAVRTAVSAEVESAREAAEASGLPAPEEAVAEVCAGVETRNHWTRQSPPDPRRA